MTYYCPLYPCLPRDEWTWARAMPAASLIRMSASFPTLDAYLFHIEHAHYIARVNAPDPLTTEKEDRP